MIKNGLNELISLILRVLNIILESVIINENERDKLCLKKQILEKDY
jgi:hypothetical protein